MSAAGTAGLDEGGSVADDGIDDSLSADTLSTGVGSTALCEGEADLAVVDRDALERPAPVPDGVDGWRIQ